MSRPLLSTTSLLSLCAIGLLAACSDETETPDEGGGGAPATGGSGGEPNAGGAGGAGGAPAEVSSCKPYTPAEAGEMRSEDWSMAGETDDYSITIPDEPGGGYVTLTVDTTATGMSPSLVVQAAGDTSGAVVSGSSAGLPDQSKTTHVFEVAGGMTYNVAVGQFGAADEPYPVDYTMTWEYTGVADCYELNDEPSQAKPIPLDEEVTAYIVSGFTTNGFSNPSLVDWYSVDLGDAGILEVELVQAPGDEDRMSIRIFDETGTDQIGGGSDLAGMLFTSTTTDPVDPGTYLIAVETVDAGSRISTKGDPRPQAWSTPYVIEASVR